MCSSGAAISKAGTHSNSTLIAYGGTNATILDTWSTEAEGMIEAESGMSIKDNFASYVLSGAASDVCSSLIAQKIVAYDPTGYLRREADTLLNVNDEIINRGLKNIKDFSKTTLSNPT